MRPIAVRGGPRRRGVRGLPQRRGARRRGVCIRAATAASNRAVARERPWRVGEIVGVPNESQKKPQ